MMMACIVCHKEFEPTGLRFLGSTFCSRQCSAKYGSIHGKKSDRVANSKISVPCTNCQQSVLKYRKEVARFKNSFCGKSCRSKYISKAWRTEANPNPPTEPKICPICSVSFKKDYASETCSNACMGELKKRRLDEVIIATNGVGCTASAVRNYLLRKVDKACRLCSHSEWMGKPIPLQMDHINGDDSDNRLENVRMLCGTCHTQTPTWGNKNREMVC